MKKCIICGENAEYIIKDSSDAYCAECAIDCFSDTSVLVHVEEQAKELKELVKKEIESKFDLEVFKI
jgi:hypothetical protein